MKSLRILSLLAVFILLASSGMPVLAQGEGPKDPDAGVAWVETFEVVRDISVKEYKSRHPFAATQSVLAATACRSFTKGRNGMSTEHVHIWTYSWTIDWCYNGSTITSVNAYRSTWTALTWSYLRDTSVTSSGGVGRTSYSHYGQGEFCWLDVSIGCVAYSYPWVNQTVRGNGTYSGTAGGD